MNISQDNRSIVNILGAPIIIASILISHFSFFIFIFFIILFSFYEYFLLIRSKSIFTFQKLFFGFLWISSIFWFIPIYYSTSSKFVLVIFFSVWITDSAAFIMGKTFGKKKVLPQISPNKTWIGSLSGLFFSMFFLIGIYINFNFFYKKRQRIGIFNV